jgi:hypothetical protein
VNCVEHLLCINICPKKEKEYYDYSLVWKGLMFTTLQNVSLNYLLLLNIVITLSSTPYFQNALPVGFIPHLRHSKQFFNLEGTLYLYSTKRDFFVYCLEGILYS